VLSKSLSDAVRKGLLVRNVTQAASPPSERAAKAPEQQWWTPEDLRRFLDLAIDDASGPLYAVAGLSGMRRGEVCALRWSDFDFDARWTAPRPSAAQRGVRPARWRLALKTQKRRQLGAARRHRCRMDRHRPRVHPTDR
jgi:integrase